MAVEILSDPAAFRHLGQRGRGRYPPDYAIDVTLPRLAGLFEQAVDGK